MEIGCGRRGGGYLTGEVVRMRWGIIQGWGGCKWFRRRRKRRSMMNIKMMTWDCTADETRWRGWGRIFIDDGGDDEKFGGKILSLQNNGRQQQDRSIWMSRCRTTTTTMTTTTMNSRGEKKDHGINSRRWTPSLSFSKWKQRRRRWRWWTGGRRTLCICYLQHHHWLMHSIFFKM